MSERANDPNLEAVRLRYRERMNDMADNIATGSCQSFEDYKFQIGVLEGLVMAERDLLDHDIVMNKA